MSLYEEIENTLQRAFTPDELEVTDDSRQHAGHAGARSGGHFSVLIVAEAFRGRSLLERHRLVYDALSPLKSGIHALSVRALAPGEI